MNTHLRDEELTAAIAGLDISPEAAEHLASCVSCRQQTAQLQGDIADRRAALEAGAPDWQLQHHRVMSRLGDLPNTGSSTSWRWLRPVMAVAAALVVAVGIRLSMVPGESGPPVRNDLPVEEIFAEVDAVLADDSLPGFEPIDFGVDDPASLIENGTS